MSMIIDGINGLTFNNSTTQASAGQVLQIVNVAYATYTSTTSPSPVNTGLSATITPKFATSKILVSTSMYAQSYPTSGSARDTGGNFALVRASTNIWNSNDVNFYLDGGTGATLTFNLINLWNLSYLDSPATTSSTTYKIQFNSISGRTMIINNGGSNAPSTITLMEIAA